MKITSLETLMNCNVLPIKKHINFYSFGGEFKMRRERHSDFDAQWVDNFTMTLFVYFRTGFTQHIMLYSRFLLRHQHFVGYLVISKTFLKRNFDLSVRDFVMFLSSLLKFILIFKKQIPVVDYLTFILKILPFFV